MSKKDKEELKSYYNLVRKIITLKILSKRAACNLATLFMIADLEPKEHYKDYLYNKLLDVHIKTYS